MTEQAGDHAPIAPRTPWRPDFPQVVLHTVIALRDNHPAYVGAKAGDTEAALMIAEDLLSGAATQALAGIIAGRPAILLPITALETTGFNAIPARFSARSSLFLSVQAISSRATASATRAHLPSTDWYSSGLRRTGP